MKNESLHVRAFEAYESPSAVAVSLEVERILCDSIPSGGHDSFTEEHDWGFGW